MKINDVDIPESGTLMNIISNFPIDITAIRFSVASDDYFIHLQIETNLQGRLELNYVCQNHWWLESYAHNVTKTCTVQTNAQITRTLYALFAVDREWINDV